LPTDQHSEISFANNGPTISERAQFFLLCLTDHVDRGTYSTGCATSAGIFASPLKKKIEKLLVGS
jgi:hypothetical protein